MAGRFRLFASWTLDDITKKMYETGFVINYSKEQV